MNEKKDLLPELESFKNEVKNRIVAAQERGDQKAVSNLNDLLNHVNLAINDLMKQFN